MTTQESFKKRVRARMATTGERYTTARLALLAKVTDQGRTWAARPEMGDDAVRAGSGRSWNDWCDLIDSWPQGEWDHAAVARRLQADHDVSGWWAQTITGGYERIAGLRLPGQMPDGTFTANKSMTVSVDADELRELLIDDGHRQYLFPDQPTTLRSRPSSKTIRLALGGGVALIGLTARADGRTTVSVQHEKLPTSDHIDHWKFWWSEWLEAIDRG